MPASRRKRQSDMARTQKQRREETVARLLDASIESIVEVGYARASAAVIARRAQVSDGALFRHFPTMGDFMAATAHEVMRRQLDLFTKQVAAIPADRPALEAALSILRDVTGNATNAVMYELLVAARTDEKLRATLQTYSRSMPPTSTTSQGCCPAPISSLRRPSRRWWRFSPTSSTAPRSSVRYCRSLTSRPSGSRCWRRCLAARVNAPRVPGRFARPPHVPAARTSARGP